MKYKSQFIATACVAALALMPAIMQGADKKKTPAASSSTAIKASPTAASAKSARAIPFHGMVSAVDPQARTFTISGKKATRVFKITDKTEITKGTSAGTINDIVANEEVRGSYWKTDDGTLEAKKVTIGKAGASEKKPKKSQEKPEPSPTPEGTPSA